MTDLVSQLVGALERLLNSDSDGSIATASEDELTLAAHDMEADPVIREQAASVLQARAALTAAKAGGWVAVPVEPTEEMIREVEHAARLGAVWTAASVYKAMLSARPTTPPKEQA